MATPSKGFSVKGGVIRADIIGLTDFQRDLKKLAPEVRKAFDKRLKAIVRDVVADAQSRASWSSRIPRAIGPSLTRRGAGVRIRRDKAPHGSIYELGSGRNSGTVRHPLFGDTAHWFSSPTRLFLGPAVDDKRDEAVKQALEAVEDAAKEVGF